MANSYMPSRMTVGGCGVAFGNFLDFPSLSGGNNEEKSTSFYWAVVVILENRSSRGSIEGSPVAEIKYCGCWCCLGLTGLVVWLSGYQLSGCEWLEPVVVSYRCRLVWCFLQAMLAAAILVMSWRVRLRTIVVGLGASVVAFDSGWRCKNC
ncbi:hypothetical protein NC651_001554 [Populus alba x Populus x berolinensis]|nr:hypothetical protein NC651_001554 [Populus alba x Populus x berolinensis]